MVFYGLLAGVADPVRKLSEVFSRLQAGVGRQRPHLQRCWTASRRCAIRRPPAASAATSANWSSRA